MATTKYRSCTVTPVHIKNICRKCHASDTKTPFPERHRNYNPYRKLKPCSSTIITTEFRQPKFSHFGKDGNNINKTTCRHTERIVYVMRGPVALKEMNGMIETPSEIRQGRYSVSTPTFTEGNRRRKKLQSIVKQCVIL